MAGTREVVVPGTPYVIPYRLRSDRLEIIAVFHGRQSHVLNHVPHTCMARRSKTQGVPEPGEVGDWGGA